jgi:hypothetical protein
MADMHRPQWLAPLLWGTLAVGVLDILDAFIFFGLKGVAPTRILQAIAAGVLGREAAVAGGLATAALGLVLHFVIACGIVSAYMLVSRRVPALARSPWVFGPMYGVLVFFIMQLVVLPLSRTAGGGGVRTMATATLINGLLIHALGVGIPAALAARAAWRHADRLPHA